jgi:H+/Cl- antiporter ClcA
MLNKVILFLAENPAPEIDPDRVRPGVLGLLTFLILGIAVAIIAYFLIRSLKKTDKRFKEDI